VPESGAFFKSGNRPPKVRIERASLALPPCFVTRCLINPDCLGDV